MVCVVLTGESNEVVTVMLTSQENTSTGWSFIQYFEVVIIYCVLWLVLQRGMTMTECL